MDEIDLLPAQSAQLGRPQSGASMVRIICPTKIGPSGCSCEMPVNEKAMMAADMIGFMESVV
jgi:hypothetical protein